MTDFFPGAFAKSDPDAGVSGDRVIMPFLQLGERLKAVSARAAQAESRDILVRTIEGEIIPRLMLTLADVEAKAGAAAEDHLAPTDEERTRFLMSVLKESAASSRAVVTALIGRGVPREAIYLDLMTSAARRLGDMWERDEADFTDVTIGLCRLHQLLREQSAVSNQETAGAPAANILLTTASMEQHVFGLVMVAEFFRRAGWNVWSEPAAAFADLLGLLEREWFDAIGVSAASDASTEMLAADIRKLRSASRNPAIIVLVGGALFNRNPELVATVGADATAPDGKAAVELGRRLVASALRHS